MPKRNGESVVEPERVDLVGLHLGLCVSHGQAALALRISLVPTSTHDLHVVLELTGVSGVSAHSLVKLPPGSQLAFTAGVTNAVAVRVKLIVVSGKRTVIATIALFVIILIGLVAVANDDGQAFRTVNVCEICNDVQRDWTSV